MRSTFRKHTESKADSDSRFRVLVLDSSLDLESKIDSQSHQNLESSLLDSLSHGYCLDSQNRLFAQKKKGFPSPRTLKAPKKSPLFAQPQSISFGGSASLFPLLAQSLRRHYCLLFPTIAHHAAGECRLVLSHLHIDWIFAAQKWQNLLP